MALFSFFFLPYSAPHKYNYNHTQTQETETLLTSSLLPPTSGALLSAHCLSIRLRFPLPVALSHSSLQSLYLASSIFEHQTRSAYLFFSFMLHTPRAHESRDDASFECSYRTKSLSHRSMRFGFPPLPLKKYAPLTRLGPTALSSFLPGFYALFSSSAFPLPVNCRPAGQIIGLGIFVGNIPRRTH